MRREVSFVSREIWKTSLKGDPDHLCDYGRFDKCI